MMHEFVQANAERLPFADKVFDLTFTSPPYIDCRTYGIDAQRDCREWIRWMLVVVKELVRVTNGLVLVNCAGVTRDWNYQPGPEGLLYEWWQMGGRAWRPAYWHRVGIPGSGGKQWLRADIEYVLAFTGCEAAIPWADNTANGNIPVYAPGGAMSYRNADGARKTGKSKGRNSIGFDKYGGRGKDKDGKKKITRRISCGHGKDGDTRQADVYEPPDLSNPGVLVEPEMTAQEVLALWTQADELPGVIKGIKVGGGVMGNPICHKNEAPFPIKLAQWFIRSFCKPGGLVLDAFSGSGTTVDAAVTLGRSAIGCDLRLSQCELGRQRLGSSQPELFV